MTAGHATAGGEPYFVGRDSELAAALQAAAGRPGLVVVVGATWVGSTRFAAEVVAALEADGSVRVRLRGGGPLPDRLGAGLSAAGLRADPVKSSELRPFAALLDDIDDSFDLAWELGETLAGTPGLLIACMREIPAGPSFVELDPLDEEAAREIVDDVAPTVGEVMLARFLALGGGRPGVLVPLARANRTPASEDTPLRLPPALVRAVQPTVDAIDPAHVDIARWASVLGSVFEPSHLVRLTSRSEDGLAPILDALAASGLLEELPGPGPLRLGFTDPLVAEVVRQATPPSELRRRHAAVLGARRARGAAAAELVQYAIGSFDPHEVVGLSLRAAAFARERGEPARALAHADRALAWCDRRWPEGERLEAMLERGLALAGIGQWDEATQALRDVIRRQRKAGNEGAAIRAATEWARVRWYAGHRQEAFEVIHANVPDGHQPLAERAQALTQAAMFAQTAGRHSEALEWATRAHGEATAAGDVLTAIRAVNAIGLASVRSSASPDGLAHFRQGLEQARAAGLWRQVAVTMNNESVCLLMLGMVRRAADRAQEGLDVVDAHNVAEVDAPLTHNLAEAMTAMGRLHEARRVALRSRAAFEALGSRSLAHLDGLIAWIDFCQGKIPEALEALRSITADADPSMTIEHMGPLSAFHAHAAQAAGEADEARAVARAAVESWRGTEDRVDAIGLLGAACEVLPAAEAKPVRAELAVAAEAGAPLARALLPYAEGWAARSAGPKVAAFREASARFAEAGLQWWSARALMLAGEAGGVKPDAVEDLLEARRLFREMEAPGWRAQCEAALRARGHKFVMASRHRDSSGLSEREVEVLEQLALGLTNREIGHRLYISEKTVGRHLERIFAKLAVTSRTAAVSAAQELGIVTEVAAQVVTTP